MNSTASLTLCQYCEHANPADAKFCAGCGAPLHLIPCPLCGAVNQKTSKTCYHCHGELRESTEILLASAPASASEEAAGNAESAAMPSPYVPRPVSSQRQPIVVVAIILAAFTVAGYFAYQQRGAVDSKGITPTAGTGNAPTKTPASLPVNLTAGAINKASPAPKLAETEVSPPAVASGDVAAAEAARAVAPPLTKAVDSPDAAVASIRQTTGASRASRRRAQADAAVSPEVGTRASSGIEKQAPRIGPCNEGLAALGLCTSAPAKGKE